MEVEWKDEGVEGNSWDDVTFHEVLSVVVFVSFIWVICRFPTL